MRQSKSGKKTKIQLSKKQNKNKTKIKNMNKTLMKLIGLGVGVLAVTVLLILLFDWKHIQGNEFGIKETWSQGVVTNTYSPGWYLLKPGETMYTYDCSLQVFEMSQKKNDGYKVQSLEGQDMTISWNVRWRIDPTKLVQIHKTVRKDIENKLIRPFGMRIVKDQATPLPALIAYSGNGLVKLQADIQNQLSGQGEGKELQEQGVIISSFVVEHIDLDPKYIEEIKQKQIATQKQLRLAEEEKAATAQALVSKAEAQADFNKRVVEAERDAKVMITAAQAENEKAIIAARAEQQKLILEAEGKKQSMVAIADGTLAQGKAEAQAKQLMLQAWAVPGADIFVRNEIAKSLSEGTKNIKGYLPEGMTVNLLSDNFMKAVETIVGGPIPTEIKK